MLNPTTWLSKISLDSMDKHSCETAINGLLLEWKTEFENDKKIIEVFLDLLTFKTINRNRLLLSLVKELRQKHWME